MSCVPLLKACNYQVDVVDKSHCGLAAVPDDILRYGRSVDELLLDANQLRNIPKVQTELTHHELHAYRLPQSVTIASLCYSVPSL